MLTQQDRDFEKFLGGPTQSMHDRIHVTLNPQNVIGLNGNCYRLMGRPPAVFLHYSRVRDAILVEPTQNPRLPMAFPVKPKTSVGWRINASPFCKHFNIRVDATHRFLSPDIAGGKLYLKLSETVVVRQIRRKKNKNDDER